MALEAQAADRQARLAGIGMMLLGIFMFSVNDVMGKWLVATYAVGQILLVRSAAALVALGPFLREAGVEAFTQAPRPKLQAFRAVLSALEVALFYWAVTALPLVDTVTFYLAGPIYVTALSTVILGERVGWRRWSAVLVGFVGVLIALNPSALTLTWPALIALAGSLCFALLMIVTRQLRGTPDTVLVTWQTLGTLAIGLAIAPLHWVAPTMRDFALIALLGVVALVAHMCVNRSLKLAPASVVVPYQYTLIVWAAGLGYLVFGDVPQAHTLVGAAIIMAAGFFIFLREQTRGEAHS